MGAPGWYTVALVLTCALPLHAQTTEAPAVPESNPLLGEGIAAYDELEYEDAIRKLSAALLVPRNTPDQNREIYRYLGLSYLLLERPEQATGAFRNLLALSPDDRFDAATAPRIVEFFEAVRRQWEADGRPGVQVLAAPALREVRIQHVAPGEAAGRTALRLALRLSDPDVRASAVALRYRSGGHGAFARVLLRGRAPVEATIPARAVLPGTVEYYFEVLDASGVVIASRGDVDAPLRVLVSGPASGGSVLGRWWFWTGAAAVVGGAVVLGVVLSGGGDGSNGTTPAAARVRINVVEAGQ